MAKKSNLIGSVAFLVGVVLAVILGLLGSVSEVWLYILIALGLIIGLFNIAGREVGPFLMSGLTLIIASVFGQNVMQSVDILYNILQALLAVFVPATIIVAVRNVFVLARN